MRTNKFGSTSALKLSSIENLAKEGFNKTQFTASIRSVLQDGYCVYWEYNKSETTYKNIVISMHTSLIRGDSAGYDIKFDVIRFCNDEIYEAKCVGEECLFNEYTKMHVLN